MRNKIDYEFVVEPVDQYNDIIDPIFCETAKECFQEYRDQVARIGADDGTGSIQTRVQFGVRRLESDDGGVWSIEYGYADDNFNLPTHFEHLPNMLVPKKIQNQWNKAKEAK